jgi:hypothetical protein
MCTLARLVAVLGTLLILSIAPPRHIVERQVGRLKIVLVILLAHIAGTVIRS